MFSTILTKKKSNYVPKLVFVMKKKFVSLEIGTKNEYNLNKLFFPCVLIIAIQLRQECRRGSPVSIPRQSMLDKVALEQFPPRALVLLCQSHSNCST
jgi:hypothetical protein